MASIEHNSSLAGPLSPGERNKSNGLREILPSPEKVGVASRIRFAMHANEPSATILRFGAFEADLQSGCLTNKGKRIRLQEQPFQLLVMLLEASGQVVTRDELRSKLWPQTIIDFDHGLNKAISKIREALGDSSEHPRFVETVARRGYRFLADVAVIRDKHGEAVPAEPVGTVPSVSSPATAGSAESNIPQFSAAACCPRPGADCCSRTDVAWSVYRQGLFLTGDPLLGGPVAGKSVWRYLPGLLRRRHNRRIDHAACSDQRITCDLSHVGDDLQERSQAIGSDRP